MANFIRTTIKIFDCEEDAYKLEAEIVNEDFVKREDTYNLALGGRETSMANGKKKIYMYNLDGEFEKEFESLREASLYLSPTCHGPGHLPRAIRLGHQYLGHQFSYEKVPYMKKLKSRKLTTVDKPNIGPKVGQYNDAGDLIKVYENMTACVKAGFKNAKQVAIGKRDHCKGYIFKYLD